MARYPITRLEADGFGPLDEVDIRLSPTLNIVTGENATGKSQLLKLLYAGTRSLSGRPTLTKSALSSDIAEALIGIFRPDQLGRLARRVQGRGRARVELKYGGISDPLAFDFASNARSDVRIVSLPRTPLDDTPVFLPSRELLSLYPGLVSLFETREVEFDETWRDTALLLGRSALRGPRVKAATELLAPLLGEIEGTVLEENGRFYVRLPGGTAGAGKIEAHLVSEGFRKLAMIIRLVSNGVLLEGGYLFWDEPEANLNPKTQRAVARTILALARSGTQVFVATHSVFLLRELELLLEQETQENPIEPRYIGLYREAPTEEGALVQAVRAETATDPADLSAIAALEAESSQSLRYLGV
ncbi:AAA family ATPase [Nocardiopsis sp. N85]|uniref:AAA family ATPase n=1 Tax=Nocardiopsis sp. N85 TaxID=3029400 RepID=UPI00237F8B9D|nr:AAA family ATPase [Nocardiopsis sp. N85]MDE3724657.1 AAA family ATPase [Nocardiopsis sp. N85]